MSQAISHSQELQEKANQLKSDYDLQVIELSGREDELAQAKERYETSLSELNEQLVQSEEMRLKLVSQLESKSAELKDSLLQVDELRGEVSKLESRTEVLTRELSESKKENEGLQESLQEQQEALSKAKKESLETLETLGSLRDENSQLQRAAKTLGEDNSILSHRVEELELAALKVKNEQQLKDEKIAELTETLRLVAQQKAVLALEKVIANSNVEKVRAIAEAVSPDDLLELGLANVDVEVLKEAPLLFNQAIEDAKERLWVLENPQQKMEAEELPLEVLGKAPARTTKEVPLEPIDLESFREEHSRRSPLRRSDSFDEFVEEDEFVEKDEFFEEEERRDHHRLHSSRTSLKPASGAPDQLQRDAFDALIAAIDQSRDYELLQLISRAGTKEDLFNKTEFGRLNSRNVHALLDDPDEIGKIAERARSRLDRLDDSRQGEKHNILKSRSQWQALERLNREALKGQMEKIVPLQEIRKELRYLGETPMTGVNPAFQGSAKLEAMKLEPHFKELADGVDIIVPYLYKQRCIIKEFLGGLPTDQALNGVPYKDEVNTYRKVLTRYLHRVEDELRIHMPVQKLLKGNEDKKNLLEQQGMLQNIKQAKEDLKDLRQLSSIFKVSYTDYPIAEKNNHLDSSGKTGPGASLEVYEPDNTRPYQMVDRVKPDHFREHTVAVNNQVVGRFIEERVSGIDRIGVKPKVKLTVTSFPPATDPNGRVAYSVAMVTQLLAGLKEPPSAKNPIILRGENSEQLEYLWTALMIIGDKSPQMKFGPETIKISSSKHFNPDKEMGQGAEKFSPDSCYKKNFETCPQLNMLVADVAKLTSDKFGHKENQQKVHSHSGQAVTIFKGKMKEALEEMKQDNVIEERGPHSIK